MTWPFDVKCNQVFHLKIYISLNLKLVVVIKMIGRLITKYEPIIGMCITVIGNKYMRNHSYVNDYLVWMFTGKNDPRSINFRH